MIFLIETILTNVRFFKKIHIIQISIDKILFTSKQTSDALEFFSINNIVESQIEKINIPKGKIALPGLVDSHVHPYFGRYMSNYPNLSKCESYEEVKEIIKKFIRENPYEKIIFCSGYNDFMFLNKALNRFLLDEEISRDKALIIKRFDFHAIIANTKALEMAKITSETVAPEGGKIDFFEEGDFKGQPTGLIHDSATKLVLALLPQISEEEKVQMLKKVNDYIFSNGVTSYMDAYVSEDMYNIYAKLHSHLEDFRHLPRVSLSFSPKKLFLDYETEEELNKGNIILI